VNAKRGQPWSEEELEKLKSLIDVGRTVPEIARLLDRTQEGVRRRAAVEGWYASPSLFYCPLPRQKRTDGGTNKPHRTVSS
jgi:hypothetical protein